MSLNSQHPEYTKRAADWILMQDSYEGERAIKDRGVEYLPACPSHELDGIKNPNDKGSKAYERYKQRAVYWEFVRDGVESLVGLLHMKAATIKLPKRMEPLRDHATREGESLMQLLRRIHEAQLTTGRIGLLADLPANPDPASPMPYIATYNATAIPNWDDSNDFEGKNVLKLVVLNETAFERVSGLAWTEIQKYRVLEMLPQVGPQEVDPTVVNPNVGPLETIPAGFVYKQGLYRFQGGTGYDASTMRPPMLRGQSMDEIPFVFINGKDLLPLPDVPPLVGLARLCLAIYRGEADYRQSLFMQGQDTLVIIGPAPEGSTDSSGNDINKRVGAGATIEVNLGGDAKYVGVNSSGLPEQRQALESDRKVAATKAGQLVAPDAGKQESGDALTTRVSAQTASLQQIALTGAAGLEKSLRFIAKWMGEDPNEVSVEANTEFVNILFTAKDLSDLMDARIKGLPMSLKSIHTVMLARGMTELQFEEELSQILQEQIIKGAAPVIPLHLLPPPVSAPAA